MKLTGALAALVAATSVGLLKSTPARGDEQIPDNSMEVSTGDSRPASRGPAETFTGEVSVKPLFNPDAARTTGAAEVSFTPCARTAWHTHPGGQTLIVTAGEGWIQQWGGRRLAITTGDVIWTPPGVKHWHGATDTTTMTHIAIQDTVDGRPVDWLEHVSDDQYLK
jgi:quercetin dioxygenase-like cupin family protein